LPPSRWTHRPTRRRSGQRRTRRGHLRSPCKVISSCISASPGTGGFAIHSVEGLKARALRRRIEA
jgi:hypothetical protein